jgi:hypothetical protein
MNEPHDPNRTADVPSSTPVDSLDAGLAAGFGRPAVAPRSSLGDLRPVLLKEAEGESAHVVKPKSDAMPSPDQTGDRYQLQGEIARGGMGAVLRGRDVDLGRDLAVKVLLEKYADRPDVARRFIEEAQIGGQLQHPGVVPVGTDTEAGSLLGTPACMPSEQANGDVANLEGRADVSTGASWASGLSCRRRH